MARGIAYVGVLVLFATACASSTDPTIAEQTTTTVPEVTTTTVAQTATTMPADPTATSTTTATATTTSTTLAGDPIRGFATAGDELVVVGVAYDDVLNIRAGPGIAYEIVAAADPTGAVIATGAARDLGLSIWYGVTTNGTSGWVNATFVAFGGSVDDVTEIVVGMLREYPTAASMEDLGLIVAETQASTEPVSNIVMSVAPTLGDLGEVTFDVIGLGDDSIYGYRVHVFADPVGDGFSLHTVERRDLCGRGVTAAGLCV